MPCHLRALVRRGSLSSRRSLARALSIHHGQQLPSDKAPLQPGPCYSSLIRHCRDARAIFNGMLLHTIIVDNGLELFSVYESSLVHMYAISGYIEDANHLLSRMHQRDKFTWTNMMKAYGEHELSQSALLCFDRMQQEGILPDMFLFATALSECSASERGCQLHSIVASPCMVVDVVIGTSLVNMYGKSGKLDDALTAFNSMVEHDIASWNAIISSYAQNEMNKYVMELLEEMQVQGVSPNKVTFIGILPAFAGQEVLRFGKEIHHLLTQLGFESDTSLGNALISMYGKCFSLDDAREVFELLPEKNTLSWTIIITCCVQNGQCKDALVIFEQMQREGAIPDKVTYINILSACADEVALTQGRMVHATSLYNLVHFNIELKNALVNMYSKCGNISIAQMVFNNMSERSTISWNAMISAFIKHGQIQNAIQLFSQMQDLGYVPDKVAFLSMLSACAEVADANLCDYERSLHSCIMYVGLDTNVVIGNGIVYMYLKKGAMNEAQKVFNNLDDRNSVSWNIMISEQVQADKTVVLSEQMLQEAVMPCKGTFVSLLSASGSLASFKLGKQVHARIAANSSELDVATVNRLIDMYNKCGKCNYAQDIFEDMHEHNNISWTEMIAGYTNSGQSKLALQHFDQMQLEGFELDRVTYLCIFSACANHMTLAKGMLVHACIRNSALESDISVGNALINMYGRCGSLTEAYRVFTGMPRTDVVSWSTMIASYAQHGYSKKALEVFHDMHQKEVLPDSITFISVLCACSHSGQLAEGLYWFDFMTRKLSIKPTLDHYNCMIDLFGRAGMLEQAENMISDMPCKADAVSWMTLLCACRYHVDVERGERAAENVFVLDPLEPAPYVVLSNIYSAAGREDEAVKVISMMKERGLNQGTPSSSIEIDSNIHEFYDDDKSHPQIEEIRLELKSLCRKMLELRDDYNPDLVQLDDDGKLHNLSENLALGFGLISTPSGTPLIISKRLQICGDSHFFMKLVSRVVDREIILINSRQFHHMRNGNCSCGDFF